MFETLFGTTTTASIQLAPFVTSVACALALGLVLAFAYSYRSGHTHSFFVTLATLPAIVCVVIAMVNGNVGAGVAVAGAFSLVRFRSAPGNARDIAFIFLAMCVGLVCGMGYVGYAALVTLIIGGANVLLQATGLGASADNAERSLRITVPEDLDFSGAFDDLLNRYCTRYELRQIKTSNMGSLYKLSYDVRLADAGQAKALMDDIRTRNGNLEVALCDREANHEVL